jgi:transcriptional antiterminator RfaH
MSTAIPSSSAAWYVIQTKSRQELRALEQLENQGYTCFLPTLTVEKIRRGRRGLAAEPLFSRYLFIALDTVASNWAPLRSTRGVSKLVAFGGRFATVPDTVIDVLRQERLREAVPLFEQGEKVAITSGPFAGLEGIYQMADGDARALVLMELIGQPHKLVFDIELLRKAA